MKRTMPERALPVALPAPHQLTALKRGLVALLVALIALLPRIVGLADFFTTDEAYHWISRSERFGAALAAGKWAETMLTGHPGVTLMWLGNLGLQLQAQALAAGWIIAPDRLEHLAWLRLGPALAHALAISAAYLLLTRLVRPAVALVSALLWATSPFLIAQGRLLHLDALLTDLVMLTLLAAMVACTAVRPWPWLIVTGVLCGLALLTKGPALIVLPPLGLILFSWAGPHLRQPAAAPWMQRLGWALSRYLLVLGIALFTILLLWPALWVAPEYALGRYVEEIIGNGGRPNGDGQFFLGQSVGDPGPLFYPLIGLYRLTPLELLGLLLLPPLIWRWTRLCSRDALLRRERMTLISLGAFALFWLLVMNFGPKKFDRYILPMWPALLTLSAYGLIELGIWLAQLLARLRRTPAAAAPATRIALPITLILLLVQGLSLAWYHPYYLSYYNPLLGGGRVAQNLFLIGWGEGMDQVGAWLRAQPDINNGQIIAALPPTLQPFVPVPVQEIRAIDQANPNYAVVYLESRQRGDAPEIYARIEQSLPLHTITIHGIEYARIYQLVRPFSEPVGAEFGGLLRLPGYSVEQHGTELLVTPVWDVRARPPGDLLLFLHLLDADGVRVAQVDLPPGGTSVGPTSTWQPGMQVAVPIPLSLPAELRPGRYHLVLGLYDPASGTRLPLSAGAAADAAWAGADAALLGSLELEAP